MSDQFPNGQTWAQSQGYTSPNQDDTWTGGQMPVTQKSRVAAGVLGILLGCLGVHNFYLGFTGKAVIQLLITLLSFGTLSWVSWVWGLIEGILYLTGRDNPSWSFDARGVPLAD